VVRREASASAGLLPVKGTFNQVRIGSLIQGYRATNDDVWEIIDMRHPAQFDHGSTPWFRARQVGTESEVSIPPKPGTYTCTFMVAEDSVDPDVEKPKLDPETVGDPSPLSDGPEIALLVEKLGATLIASRDNATGVWHCPPYEQSPGGRVEYVSHIEIAHGISLEAADTSIEALTTLHGRAHADSYDKPSVMTGGFPHVHDYQDSTKPFGNLL
jgi:hypothetical protein